jgi:two-component system sensor histidine kinase KdpD
VQSKQLCNKVDDLLDMMKLETQKSLLEKHWQPIEEVITSAIQYFNSLSSFRDVKVAIDPQTPMLFFDEVLLERVIYNLLDNAAKCSSINSPIEIFVRPSLNAVEVEVKDLGDGFVTIPGPLLGSSKGNKQDSSSGVLGLGLSICKTIIQSHGGSLWAENHSIEAGASVFFTIPIVAIPSSAR